MLARVLKVRVPTDRVDALLAAYHDDVRPIHAAAAGLRQHYVLVNRDTGWVQIIGIWDSADDVANIASVLEPARQRLWQQFGSNPPIDLYEVSDELR